MNYCHESPMKWLRGGMLAVLAVSFLAGRAQAADEGPIGVPDLTITSGPEKLTVSWEAVEDADAYQIQWRENKATPDPWGASSSGDITGLTYDIPNLDASKTYQVRGFAKDGNGDYSNPSDSDGTEGTPFTPHTGTPAPGAVMNVTVTPGSEKLEVSWDRLKEATGGYKVQWKWGAEKYSDSRLVGVDQASSARLSVTINDVDGDANADADGDGENVDPLSADTEYTVKVTATNDPDAATESPGDPSDGGDGSPVEKTATPTPAQVMGVMVASDKEKPGELKVTWGPRPVVGATGYTVEWKSETDNDYGADRRITANQDELEKMIGEDTPLDPGTRYTVRVYATNASGPGEPSVEMTGSPSPAKVEGVEVESLAGEELTVTWDLVSGATGYKVKWKGKSKSSKRRAELTAAENAEVVSESVSGTSYTISPTGGLNPAITYAVNVVALNVMDGEGEASEEETGTPRPGQVTLADANVTSGLRELMVQWAEPDEDKGKFDSYTVQWRPETELSYDPEDQHTVAAIDLPISAGAAHTYMYRITGLQGGTAYTVRVYATNAGGEGRPSAEVTMTPTVPSENGVSGVEVTSGAKELTVNWDEIPGATFRVRWVETETALTSATFDYDSPTQIGGEDADKGEASGIRGTSHRISSLKAGTQYAVEVRATVAGESGTSGVGNAWTRPGPVTGVTVTPTPNQAGQLTVSWVASDPVPAGGYKVQWRSGDQGYDPAREVVATSTSTSEILGNGSPTATPPDADLPLDGSTYTVRVIATNAGGDGDPSAEKTGTPSPAQVTLDADAPVTPGSRKLTVKWGKADGATAYTVRWWTGTETFANTPAKDKDQETGISETTHEIPNLKAGVAYMVQVIATNAKGEEGTPSDAGTGTPLPSKVEGVNVNPGPQSLIVSWAAKDVTGVTGYKVQWRTEYQKEGMGSEVEVTARTLTIGDPSNTGDAVDAATRLDPGTRYFVQVTAMVGEAEGASSDEEVEGTPAPAAFTDFDDQTTGDQFLEVNPGKEAGTLDVLWNTVVGATAYTVQWKSGNQEYGTSHQEAADEACFTITGLTPGTEYMVRVIAENGTGQTTPSHGLSEGVTETPKPGKVTGVEVISRTTGELTVSWIRFRQTGIAYKVQWRASDTSWPASFTEDTDQKTVPSMPGDDSYTIMGLTAGTEYTVRVIATSGVDSDDDGTYEMGGDGEPSEEEPGTPIPPQVTVIDHALAFDVTIPGEATVSWTTVAGATEYMVEWRRSGALRFNNPVFISDLSYRITGLSAGDYEVQVSAKNAGGVGLPSVADPSATPPVPLGFTVSGGSVDQVTGVGVGPGVEELTVSWNPVRGATHYDVQWGGRPIQHPPPRPYGPGPRDRDGWSPPGERFDNVYD